MACEKHREGTIRDKDVYELVYRDWLVIWLVELPTPSTQQQELIDIYDNSSCLLIYDISSYMITRSPHTACITPCILAMHIQEMLVLVQQGIGNYIPS